MIMKKNNKPDTLTQRQTRRARRLYFTSALAMVLCAVLTVPAFAAGSDPLTIVNNLSEFIFSCIKAIGVIILGWGIVQLGMSIQSHDASQANLIGTVFFTLCVLSEIQATCSALASPLVGELVNSALMVCAAFWDYPVFWPRYSMLLRSSTVEADGYIPAGALAYLIVSFLGVFAMGALLFQKSNILSHNKGR